MMTNILLNIREILKTLLNMHAIVTKHCVSHFRFFLFLYFNKLLNDLKHEKIEDPIFICSSCCIKINCGKQLNMTLCEHITNNQLNFKFVLILNKIEEHLIAPRLAFT